MKKIATLASFALVCLTGWASEFAPAAGSNRADEVLYVTTHVDVIPPFTAAGRELLKEFAVASRKDSGAVRIEVLEDISRPNHSTVVEIWASRKAYDNHLAADHTRAYRTKLQPMLGSPFDERLHRLSSPEPSK